MSEHSIVVDTIARALYEYSNFGGKPPQNYQWPCERKSTFMSYCRKAGYVRDALTKLADESVTVIDLDGAPSLKRALLNSEESSQ
jgi:hypothetical protein